MTAKTETPEQQLESLRNAVFALCGHLPGVSQEEQLAVFKAEFDQALKDRDAYFALAAEAKDQGEEWRDVAGRLAEALGSVVLVSSSKSDWDGKQEALAAYDALAKLSDGGKG